MAQEVLIEYRKTGQGAYHIKIMTDGLTFVSLADWPAREFPSVQEAYDHCLGLVESGHAAWTVCYMLEDHLEA